MLGSFYEIDEVLNEAIMTGVPALIVEGVDDISIYSKLSNKVPFEIEVYAIETINGYSEGCHQVILAIEELNSLQNNTYNLADNILGVIDKDVRDFRAEIPMVEPILTLKYYSIESHFVSKQTIKDILILCIKVNRELITNNLCNILIDEIEVKLTDLYYFSLEALKKSLNVGYEASFYYSYPSGKMKDVEVKEAVLSKRYELDNFALLHQLTPCLDTLKCMAKGKWLIDVFASEFFESINTLQARCENKTINTCQYCVTYAYDKCLYRINKGFTSKTIKSLALANIDGPEFDYILNRISQIKTME